MISKFWQMFFEFSFIFSFFLQVKRIENQKNLLVVGGGVIQPFKPKISSNQVDFTLNKEKCKIYFYIIKKNVAMFFKVM